MILHYTTFSIPELFPFIYQKNLFTLAGSEGIHDMWTHSSIFFLHCLFDFIFYLYFFFVIQFRWSTYNHSITSTWIPYRLLFCQSSWWVLYTAEKLLMCLTTDIYLPNHIRDILFVFHFFLLLSPRQRSCEGIYIVTLPSVLP